MSSGWSRPFICILLQVIPLWYAAQTRSPMSGILPGTDVVHGRGQALLLTWLASQSKSKIGSRWTWCKMNSSKLSHLLPMDQDDNSILQQKYFKVWIKGRAYDYMVLLTPSGLSLQPMRHAVSTNKMAASCCCLNCCPCGRTAAPLRLSTTDLLACRPAQDPTDSASQVLLKKNRLHPAAVGYPVFMILANPLWGKQRQVVKLHFYLPPPKDQGDGSQKRRAAKVRDTWVHAIESILMAEATDNGTGLTEPIPDLAQVWAQRLLVLVNPVSGTGKALGIVQHKMEPLLKDAGVNYQVVTTGHAGHAKQLMMQCGLVDCRGVVAVSGDGLLHEVINGIFARPDWRNAFLTMPLGIVPGGSGNGLIRSLIHEQAEPLEDSVIGYALSNTIRGKTKALDMFYVEVERQEPMLGFLHISWGLIADVDIQSETLRRIGEARFTIYCLLKIAQLKKYRAKLWYLPASDYSQLDDIKIRQETRDLIDELRNKPESYVESTSECSLSDDKSLPTLDEAQQECGLEEMVLPKESRTIVATTAPSSMTLSAATTASTATTVSPDDRCFKESSMMKQSKHRQQLHMPVDAELIYSRHSYCNMLTQGQLYFRSWDELQCKVLGPESEADTTDVAPVLPVLNEVHHMVTAVREPPKFPEMPKLCDSLPTANCRDSHSTASQEGSTMSELDDWVYEEGEYVGISALNAPYIDSKSLMCPSSRTDDGILHLVIFRGLISRKQLLQVMLKLEDGTHIDVPGVEVVPVKAFRIEPEYCHGPGAAMLTLDGELLPTATVQAHIMPSLAKIFVR